MRQEIYSSLYTIQYSFNNVNFYKCWETQKLAKYFYLLPDELLLRVQEIHQLVRVDLLGGSEDRYLKQLGHSLQELSKARPGPNIHLDGGRRAL